MAIRSIGDFGVKCVRLMPKFFYFKRTLTRGLFVAGKNMDNIEELYKIESECFGNSWTLEMLKEEWENPLSVTVTKIEDGKLAAFALGRVVADEGELFQIGTLAEFRRRGIAEKLLAELHGKMIEKGAEVCFLDVRSRNAAAIALYEKCGYERISVRRNYYPDDDAVIMRRQLK